MNNNQSFNDAIKIAGIVVPIITAIITLTGTLIANGEKLQGVTNFFTNMSSTSSEMFKNPGTGSNGGGEEGTQPTTGAETPVVEGGTDS